MSGQQHSGNPDIQWAMDLLNPDPNYQPSFLQKYGSEITLTACGIGFGILRNYTFHRPRFMALQIHAVYALTGYVIAKVYNKTVNYFQAEHDTRLRNYVILHPELFPKPVRVKYADIIEPWIPIR